jgi:DNA-binding response OmpR family regulator
MDGFEVLQTLRADGLRMPIIMLTARTSTHDTVLGLDAGASDYVRKPFTVDELLARVRSRLREAEVQGGPLLRDGFLLDPSTRRASINGRDIDLSAREFALAEEFLRHAGETLSREHLLSQVWGMDFDPGSNVVDVYVGYLRTKLGHGRIATVRGAGYRWE